MKINDLINMAGKNLWRTKLRTTLTLVGVMVGIGALIAMVSFGAGLEKNITDKFKSNDLFTSLSISTKAINFKDGPRGGKMHPPTERTADNDVPLNDSLVDLLNKRPEVNVAYPRLNFPIKARLGALHISSRTGSVPLKMGEYAPYNDLYAGQFFSNDTAKEAIVSLDFLRSLGIEARTKNNINKKLEIDSGLKLCLVDTLLGKDLVLITTNLKSTSPIAFLGGIENVIGEDSTTVKIVGIIKEEQFAGPSLREEIILPIGTAKSLPAIGFDKISEMLDNKTKGNQYNSIYVKAKSMDDLKQLKAFLDKEHINYFAIDDGLKEMKKAFLILDSILGIIGLISLLVAGFGIINTMLMSIMERTREIGIMKAIGGKNRDIRLIFFFEAGSIGVLGALGGISLGYGITRIANFVVNKQYIKNPDETVDLFAFPMWLIFGSILFSILISLLAGLYPAIRASKIRPIEALRQN
ncbi:MAG TPA: FtsX-like permease family protein [Edaphocola sp.]|nr:FtsX-like permease family protein [Edaphocola sp.]